MRLPTYFSVVNKCRLVKEVIIISYIYKITNSINNKVYIGNTNYSIKKRWSEHVRDSRKERCKHRPLYYAINKYGIENFKIEKLEYVEDDSKLSDREIYWIKEL